MIIKEFLQKMNSEFFIYKLLNFSAQTNVQNLMEIFFEKEKFVKKKKDLIGTQHGKKIIIFIDDINMPLLDQYGS